MRYTLDGLEQMRDGQDSMSREERIDLEVALHRLPWNYARVLLEWLAGYSKREAARRCGVKSRNMYVLRAEAALVEELNRAA